jgi:hypothetical protein
VSRIFPNSDDYKGWLVYNDFMKNTLFNTNPYLKDPAVREHTLTRNIVSSSAVEGIKVKRDAKTGSFTSNKSSGIKTKSIKKSA